MLRAAARSLLLLSVATLGHAATIHVPADQPTIQAGIDAATAGDVVQVECGTYFERNIVLKGGITLRSATGYATCATIDAQSLGRVLLGQSLASPTRVEGFTITGGDAELSGAVGGGAFVLQSELVELVRCRLEDNFAIQGGGICVSFAELSVEDCEIRSNVGESAGGGIFTNLSLVSITGSLFEFNSSPGAYGFGGAGLCFTNGSTGVITSTTARDNGARFAQIQGSSVTFVDCLIASHSGSALKTSSADVSLTQCVLDRNRRAVEAWGGTLDLDRCTLYTNIGASSCSLTGGNVASVDRCIIVFSSRAFLCPGGNLTISCSDLFGDTEDYFESCSPAAQNVIFEDPLLCDPEAGDFRLDVLSPCRHAQSPCSETIGAFGVGCVTTGMSSGVDGRSWGAIKSLYR